MRICLLSLTYPPASTEGISRQRQALATQLATMGHEVHIVTRGQRSYTRQDGGTAVHEVAAPRTLRYLPERAALDPLLTDAQALLEGLLHATDGRPFDVIDVPLWAAQGFLAQRRHPGPFVVWLQTTSRQLLEIRGQKPTAVDHWRLSLERDSLARAHGILSDSQVALETTLRDYRVRTQAPTGVAYLGLPPLDHDVDRTERGQIEALIVGRLERRKGTPVLFELLPALLDRHPQLTVRFVGRDNSESDGWLEQHGLTYPEFFRRRHPHLAARVTFDGYVPDERLAARYEAADLLIAPSLYESFGLMYLEAMRAGLPVVTFAAGASPEIFPCGEQDGALLARPQERAALAVAIGRLVDSPELRREVGRAGRRRFQQAFTAGTMVEATLAFYERTLVHHRASHAGARPVYQVMEALAEGDAVSDVARANTGSLASLGEPPTVLTRSPTPRDGRAAAPLESALATPDCRLIFHYWGFSTSVWMLRALTGPMALYYHNITPPFFFTPGSALHEHLARGEAQLAQILERFDLLIGDSRYNLHCLAPLLRAARPALHIHPTIEREALSAAPYDRRLLARLRSSSDTNIIFVGRLAPNKRQDRVMRAFDDYVRRYNPRARLWLVGSGTFDRSYASELDRLRHGLPSGERIAVTGKVSAPQLHSYYRAANLLLCASEHEGFCVPIAQAMAFRVPVLALAAAAVPETLGGAGLIHTWDDSAVAAHIHAVLSDEEMRSALVTAQAAELRRFSAAEAQQRLAAVRSFLRDGTISPLFEQLAPAAPALHTTTP